MSNKLRSVFNTAPLVESFRVVFESEEAAKVAQKALKEIEAGESFDAKHLVGISKLIRQTSIGNDVYSMTEKGQISGTVVGPLFEPFTIPVVISGHSEELQFGRHMGTNYALIEYSKNPVFTLRLQISNRCINESRVEVSIHREKAEDTKGFYRAYCELAAIFEALYVNASKNEELKRVFHIRDYWKRVLMLEEIFGVSFDVQDLKESNVLNVNKLSLLVLDRMVISHSQNEFYHYFDVAEWEKVKSSLGVGKSIWAHWRDDRRICVYGQEIPLAVNCVIPGAKIVEVSRQEDGYVSIKYGPVNESMRLIEYVNQDDNEEFDSEHILEAAVDYNEACNKKYYS